MDKTVKILVILFAVVGIGLFGYHWFSQWHIRTIDQKLEAEKEKHLERIAQLEAEITRLTEELGAQQLAQPSKSELVNVFGAAKPMEPISPDEVDCKKITGQVVAFFQYLDSKAYLVWPGINMRAEELFENISKKLAAAPPTNVGEMEDLYSLMRNVTHFYRVLGKDRIDLLKEILNSESAVMEPAMAVIFAWVTACNNSSKQLNLNSLYQYAHFFLNTLGGRSYLLRRDPRQRMLINYYALLVIDMANDAKLNAYGLDIRPHLDYVFYDINNQKGLMYRQRYLSKLSALQNKYQ
ncbi:MAG: hypothetical protein PVH87_13620 [Desulfobacteraceae bacterium]|jgi:hypothetical protein